ncbi:MAG: type IV pilus modification PilV family protein [Candidatus Anammoxibacter sp.]
MGIIKKHHGFTLIELLIAISIISVSIIWFFNVTIFVVKSNRHNRKLLTATILAQELLEDAKGTCTASTLPLNTTYTIDGFNYTGSRTVSYGNDTINSCFFQTEVSVIWHESGATKTVEMVSFHVQ